MTATKNKLVPLASGWWYGRYWVLCDDLSATNWKYPMYWFDTAIEAVSFFGEVL